MTGQNEAASATTDTPMHAHDKHEPSHQESDADASRRRQTSDGHLDDDEPDDEAGKQPATE